MPTELRPLRLIRAHVLFEERPGFERTALALVGAGLAAGPLAALLAVPSAPAVALVLTLGALAFAPVLRGAGAVTGRKERLGLAALGAAVAFAAGPALGAVVAAALFGVVLTPGASSRVRLFAPVGTAAGLAWGLGVLHEVERWSSTFSPLPRSLMTGGVLGLLFGMGVLLLHLRWVDPVVARLARLAGSAKVAGLYRRCRAALKRGRAPVLDQLLESVATEAGQLAERLDAATRALGRVDRAEAEAELEKLKQRMAAAEPRVRAQLDAAARTWSDALEQLQSMETARARLEAALLAHTAFLERTALGLETAGPNELGSLAERLAGQRPEPLRLRAA